MLRPLIKNDAITRYRRYLSFSLRTLFILLTALAVWLGVVVNRAREQREAVKAIEALGGEVIYDWQIEEWLADGSFIYMKEEIPVGPDWLRRLIGDDFFQDVVAVRFDEVPAVNASKAIPYIQRLREVRFVGTPYKLYELSPTSHRNLRVLLQESLPGCTIW